MVEAPAEHLCTRIQFRNWPDLSATSQKDLVARIPQTNVQELHSFQDAWQKHGGGACNRPAGLIVFSSSFSFSHTKTPCFCAFSSASTTS